jgi:hypothetical protein
MAAEIGRKIDEDNNRIDFELTKTNGWGECVKVEGVRPVDPYLLNKSNQERFFPQCREKPEQTSPLRASLLQPDLSCEYEKKQRLVKSVLQKLDKGNTYQLINDLLDSLCIMFAKKMDSGMAKPLNDLNQLLLSADELLDVNLLQSHVKNIFADLSQGDEESVQRSLVSLEKNFVLKMYDFLPEYLGRQKGLCFGMNNGPIVSPEVMNNVELIKLKRDNETLKRDLGFIQQQKIALEQLVEYFGVFIKVEPAVCKRRGHSDTGTQA